MDNKIYNSEEEFLNDYDDSKFKKLSMTTDIIIFSVSDGEQMSYRKLSEKYFSILLVKRDSYPFKDKWCLPGGFVNIDESIDDAAIRILGDETNIHNMYLEQLYTFGDVKRDPRMRIVSTAYMALIDKNTIREKLNANATWFNITVSESDDIITVLLDSKDNHLSFKMRKILINKTTNRYKYEIVENKYLAFDHATVICEGITRLKNKIEYTDVVFNMMPKEFALGELQQVYEVILNKKLLDPAFRRVIADKVVKTNHVKKDAGHRPSVLFCYKDNDESNK
jgi:ADP-ribose pyrophosphatase YjhB (NUDIX family)